jgi:hypothetical protein
MTDSPDFAAVPVSARTDGWTPEKQIAFIHELATTACVATAARNVGMSRESAYRLRLRPDAESFREAWERAIDFGLHRLGEEALNRAINGVPVPIFYKGQQVGERRHFDERLTQFLLRTRDDRRRLVASDEFRRKWDRTLDRMAEVLQRAVAALPGVPPRPSRRASSSEERV